MNIANLLTQTILGNTIVDWMLALIAGYLVALVLQLIRRGLSRWMARRYDKTQHLIDDFLYKASQRTWTYLKLAAMIFTASLLLKAGTEFMPTAVALGLLLGMIQVALWGTDVINLYVKNRIKMRSEADPSTPTAMHAAGIIAKVLLWSVLLLLALDNIPNVEVNALIASLGVGSIAVALAVQNVLGDLFAALSIALDKPFEIGDFINVGDYSGSVERIGIKSTRLRSLTGEQLVFSNSDLLNSRIRNYKRMQQRRVVFTVGVAPDTPYDKLTQIPGILRGIVSAQPQVTFDRAHFTEYGDYTLNFEVVYFLPIPDFTLYMDTRQAINLEIYRRFEEEGIELPYPTQAVIVKEKQT